MAWMRGRGAGRRAGAGVVVAGWVSAGVLLAGAGPALGQCSASFTFGSLLNVDSSPGACAVADFTGDGLGDLAYTTNTGWWVATGNGSGGFSSPFQLGIGRQNAMAAVDVDLDGRPDIVSVSGTTLTVVRSLATGYSAGAAYTVPAGASGVAAADFTLDGRPDLAVSTGTGVTLLAGVAGPNGGSFVTAGSVAMGQATNGVAAGDLTGDGRPDVAVAGANGLYSFTVAAGAGGTLTLTPGLSYAFPGAKGPAIIDLNEDGRPDVVSVRTPAGPLHSYAAAMNGAAGWSITISTPTALAQATLLSAAADFEGDGHADLLAHSSGTVYLFQGNGTALPNGPFAVNGNATRGGLAVGDLNGDGRADWAGTRSSLAQVDGWINTTTRITQQPQRTFLAQGQAGAVSVGVVGQATGFRWRRDGVDLAPGGASGFGGVNTATLTIAHADVSDSGAVIDCILTGSCGSITTGAVGLVITPATPPPGCGSSDFNGDGDYGTDQDIEAFFRVLGGGSC